MKTDWLHCTGRKFIVFERKLFLVFFVKLCFLHSSSIYFIFVSSCLIVSALLLMSSVDCVIVRRSSSMRNLQSRG